MDPATFNPRAKRRACTACTSAKSKCTPHSENLCERCARLGKQCTYLDLPERRRKQRETKRIEALENTVESLKAQLAIFSQQNTPMRTAPSTSSVSVSDIPSLTATNSSTPTAIATSSLNVQSLSSNRRENAPDIVDRGIVTVEYSERLIQSFKDDFVPTFPFVSLDPAQTSLDLRHKYPFLFLCIITATMENHNPHCRAVREEMMEQLTSRLIKKAERSMDLLRGLLVRCAWYHNHHHEKSTQIVLSLQLCLTVCYDMDLEKKKNLTTEEQRAFLGVYWISVGLSRAMHKPIAMKYGRQVEEASRNVAASSEYESDKWVGPLITLQSLASRLEDSYSSLNQSKSCINGDPVIKVISESFLFELGSVKKTIEEELAGCNQSTEHVVKQEILFIEISIREIALQDGCRIHSEWHNLSASQSTVWRTSMLWQLVKSAKMFLVDFLSIPDEVLLHLPITSYSRLCSVLFSHATAALTLLETVAGLSRSRGSLSTDQKSEAQAIIDETDYIGFITALLTKLEVVNFNCIPTVKDNNLAVQFATKMRVMAHFYPARIKAILGIDLTAMGDPSFLGANTMENTLVAPLSDDQGDILEPQGWHLPVPLAEDGTTVFDEVTWSFGLNSFTGFT